MVADVQAWLDQPSGNFGWLLLGGESTSATSKRFDSKENDTPANRPVLEVEFSLPPVPGLSQWGIIALTVVMAAAVLLMPRRYNGVRSRLNYRAQH